MHSLTLKFEDECSARNVGGGNRMSTITKYLNEMIRIACIDCPHRGVLLSTIKLHLISIFECNEKQLLAASFARFMPSVESDGDMALKSVCDSVQGLKVQIQGLAQNLEERRRTWDERFDQQSRLHSTKRSNLVAAVQKVEAMIPKSPT